MYRLHAAAIIIYVVTCTCSRVLSSLPDYTLQVLYLLDKSLVQMTTTFALDTIHDSYITYEKSC